MESKASAPLYPPTGIQDAPPSYEASMSQPNYGPPPGASAAPPGKFCNIWKIRFFKIFLFHSIYTIVVLSEMK